MAQRTADDFAHERASLDAAHAPNEAGRDAFTALAHTALFASPAAGGLNKASRATKPCS